MIKKILLFLLICNLSHSQVFINELDPDTPSMDTMEFVELKSTTPNFPLNGYVLVFFNGLSTGTGILSYYSYDLDGYSTDANGIVHFGNPIVSPTPSGVYIPNTTIQNGPDGVALYLGNAVDFPTGTPAVSTNLISSMCYSNNNTVLPSALMAVFGTTVCINENQTLNVSSHSIQRKNDGTYELKLPTPGANNDGTGVVFNGLNTTVTPSGNLMEGITFDITFSTQAPVISALTFIFSISNGSFNTLDYTANLSVTIPAGSTSVTKTILLVDDTLNEGDEVMKIVVGNLPVGYSILRNNIDVRINDNDFIVHNWGSPINPTHGIVSSTAPTGYYATLEGKTGAVLKQAIQDIIANPAVVHEHTYGDVYTMLKDADQNPANSGQVWLMYVEQARSKIDIQTGNSGTGFWNREHIYCQSRGGFNLVDGNPDGINIWTTTDANDIEAGGTDCHHIRAEDSPENSSRNNRNYGVDYNGPTGNIGSWHGDVARSLFYMATRYNALSVVNGDPTATTLGNIGDLATLLTWNMADTADDFEMNRNNIIYTWQKNRNPFIDYPDLVNYIWGNKVGIPWSFSVLSNSEFDNLKVELYPNPAQNYFIIDGLSENTKIEILSSTGINVFSGIYQTNKKFYFDFASGLYFVKIYSDDKSVTKKLIIN